MNDLIEALIILKKYMDDDISHPTHCEHDAFYVPTVDYDLVSDDDKSRLSKLGFQYNRDGGAGFVSYRFGSC